jgi:hypothetical protein
MKSASELVYRLGLNPTANFEYCALNVELNEIFRQ